MTTPPMLTAREIDDLDSFRVYLSTAPADGLEQLSRAGNAILLVGDDDETLELVDSLLEGIQLQPVPHASDFEFAAVPLGALRELLETTTRTARLADFTRLDGFPVLAMITASITAMAGYCHENDTYTLVYVQTLPRTKVEVAQ